MPEPKYEPLRICHFNAQSLETKLDELKHFLVEMKIQICAVNETWLKPKKSFKIPGYEVIRRDRLAHAGGVCLIIHRKINYEIISHQSSDEILAVNIKTITSDCKDLAVISYYKPPKTAFNPKPLEEILSEHQNVLLVGDLNAHHCTWHGTFNCPNGKAIVNLIQENNLCLLNNDSPTYQPLHRPNYHSIIDLAICSRSLSRSFLHFETNDQLRSDHLPIIIEFKSNLLQFKSSKTINLTDWRKFIQVATKEADKLDFDYLHSTADIDSKITKITTAIQ